MLLNSTDARDYLAHIWDQFFLLDKCRCLSQDGRSLLVHRSRAARSSCHSDQQGSLREEEQLLALEGGEVTLMQEHAWKWTTVWKGRTRVKPAGMVTGVEQ